jgi:hypothetical protein
MVDSPAKESARMNKFLLGCGILVGLLGIGGMFGAYFYLWKPAKSMVTEVTKLQEIPKLNQQIRNSTSFTPPADNTLTGESVDRFVRTQNAMMDQLGARANQLSAKYELMSKNRPNYTPTWPELVGAYKDFAALIVEAKRVQVEALNQNNFSLEEYEWMRQRIYEAAGLAIDMNIAKLIREVSEGKLPTGGQQASIKATPPVSVPEKNRELVKPHAKLLVDRAVLVAFGL